MLGREEQGLAFENISIIKVLMLFDELKAVLVHFIKWVREGKMEYELLIAFFLLHHIFLEYYLLYLIEILLLFLSEMN